MIGHEVYLFDLDERNPYSLNCLDSLDDEKYYKFFKLFIKMLALLSQFLTWIVKGVSMKLNSETNQERFFLGFYWFLMM